MDLKKSPYQVETIHGIRFYFSSRKRYERYCDMVSGYCQSEAEKLSSRYKIYIDFGILHEISLYLQIEKYGFYMEYKGEAFTCQTQVLLNGEKLTRLS